LLTLKLISNCAKQILSGEDRKNVHFLIAVIIGSTQIQKHSSWLLMNHDGLSLNAVIGSSDEKGYIITDKRVTDTEHSFYKQLYKQESTIPLVAQVHWKRYNIVAKDACYLCNEITVDELT